MRVNFHDEQSRDAVTRTRFYTVEQLGDNQAVTPEGFLLCTAVPIARTGFQLYDASEVPLSSVRGAVQVERTAEEVFRPEFIASFNGKPVCNDHPPENVAPYNWKEYTIGVVLNPRRGEGIRDDLLLADLLIYDPDGIKEIRENGKREVSCGYDADYEEVAPGKGRQVGMVGNHLAIVDHARCGGRCSISDANPLTGVQDMQAQFRDKAPSWLDNLRRAFSTNDKRAIDEALAEAEKEAGKETKDETNLHLHMSGMNPAGMESTSHDARRMTDEDIEKRFGGIEKSMKDGFEEIKSMMGGKSNSEDAEAEKAIEGDLKEEAPPGTGDSVMKSKDSAFLADSMGDAISGAEILVPGIQVPTFDRASKPADTLRSVQALRRRVLDHFGMTPEGRIMIETISGGRALDSMSNSAVRTLYRGVVAMKKEQNRQGALGRSSINTQDDQRGAGGGSGAVGRIRSAADLNKRNAEYYGV